jgi:adenylate cyclase
MSAVASLPTMSAVDFAAEGLLDGLTGKERQERLELLRHLYQSGVSIEELRQAVAEDRLVILPAERAITGEGSYTEEEVAQRAQVDLDFLLRIWRAAGMSGFAAEEQSFSDEDVEAAQMVGQIAAAGLDPDGMVEVSRVFGEAAARVAAATRNLVVESVVRTDRSDFELALLQEEVVRQLTPLVGAMFQHLYRRHLSQLIRNDLVSLAQLRSARLPGLREVGVAFVDVVGFTRFGEESDPDELGSISGRLGERASEIAEPPVWLTKMIGDAAMFVSPDLDALLDTTLRIVEGGADENGDLPETKAGVAWGEALNRWGDWYGSPVNIAARLTSIAHPGSVLVTAEVREAARGEYQWSFAGERHLKGVPGRTGLYRVRHAQ